MPRPKKNIERIEVTYPITAAEVAKMAKSAGKRGLLAKHMSDADCQSLALLFSTMTSGEMVDNNLAAAEAKYLRRWREAASLLKRTREHPNSFPYRIAPMEEIADLLERVVTNAERLLSADRSPQNGIQEKPWVTYALRIAEWASVKVQAAGSPGGFGQGSIAAEFAACAMERIGWRENGKPISASAIAGYGEKMSHNRS